LWFHDSNARITKPYVTGYALGPRDPWPGWTTPLTVDLAPTEGATPVP
jgi:hypothetical protein